MTTASTPVEPQTPPRRTSRPGEPTWEVAHLYPDQGRWSEAAYLSLSGEGVRFEYIDGVVELLPMPSELHQLIIGFLYRHLYDFVISHHLGVVVFSGLPVKLEQPNSTQYRIPDLVFMGDQHNAYRENNFWHGADLAMEVVSPDDPNRDLIEKRSDYAASGIPEYWVINPLDPSNPTITVFTLQGEHYEVHGTFGLGETASSKLLQGFTVNVEELLGEGSG